METPPVTPSADSETVRAGKRRAAGVRAAWIWGGVFVVLSLIFSILYLALDARREKAWRQSIEAALKRGDAAECAALLAECRKTQPALAKQASFAAWESRYLALQSRQAKRHAAWEAKVARLQNALQSEDWWKLDWPQELAETARLASSEEELSRIQDLRLHSEALIRREKLRRNTVAAGELAAARKDLAKLAELREHNDWKSFAKLRDALHRELETLKLKVQNEPDLAESLRRLQRDIDGECMLAQKAERAFTEEENACRKILAGGHAEEIARRIQDFLERFPASPRNPMFRTIVQELELRYYPFRDEPCRQLEKLHQREQAALEALRRKFSTIQGENCLLQGEQKAALDALTGEIRALDAAKVSAWLEAPPIPESMPWSAAAAEAVRVARHTLEPDAERLHVPPVAWHWLQQELWSEADRNVPQFAGLLDRGEFRPAGSVRQECDVWLVEAGGSQPRFVRAGSLSGLEFTDEVGVNSILRTLWAPTTNWRASARRKELEEKAQKLGAPPDALAFPLYWVK